MRGGWPVNADRAEVSQRKQRRKEPGEVSAGRLLVVASVELKKKIVPFIFSVTPSSVVFGSLCR